MKRPIITLIILFVTGLSFAQTPQVTNTENERIVTHVAGNEYSVLVMNADGNLVQEGQYYKVGERFKPHGIWKLYDNNTLDLVTRAMYDKGVQLWVETYIDGKLLKVDQQDIEVNRLKTRVAALEKKIESLDN